MQIKITSLSCSGEGIGTHEGVKVFVPNVLPGEEVEVELTEKKKKYWRGKQNKILSYAKERASPKCPLFGQCGGCQIMHLNYPDQLLTKQTRVIEALRRIGNLEIEVAPTLPSPLQFGYRNKIQLPVLFDGSEARVGLFRKNTHEFVSIDQCSIHCAIGDKVLQTLLPLIQNKQSLRYILIKSAPLNQETLVIFVTRKTGELQKIANQLMEQCPQVKGVIENINPQETNTILGKTFNILKGNAFITEKILNKNFLIPANAFFQVNSQMAEILFQTALQFAKIQPHETVIDAFCGVGTLSLFASDIAKTVIGIEVTHSAIDYARINGKLNKAENVDFFCGKSEELLHRFKKADVIFLNPPRKGCEPSLIQAIHQLKPRALVYISCDPATLARDIARLNSYRATKIQPLDLFPQTMHVETIALLECVNAL